jgi:hypothetical protein
MTLQKFISEFRGLVEKEKESSFHDFSLSLVRLRQGFEDIQLQEEPLKLEQFRNGILNLVSSVEQCRKSGQWVKTHTNIFTVLGCVHDEEVHSNILAWLFNPDESHGLGNSFLSGFIKRAFNKDLRVYSPVYITREARVENGTLDIVVDSTAWQIVIENKIFSCEGPEQTNRYARPFELTGAIGKRYFLVFLTPKGVEPNSKSFIPISYGVVGGLIRELLPRCSGDVKVLLSHFAEHLRLHL